MPFINEHELDAPPTGGRFISEADLDPTPTATATPESTLTQRGRTFGSAPAAPPNPYVGAVNEARQKYPWLSRFGPIALTSGTGPYESESYMPTAADNPQPGFHTVQLRSAKQKSNPGGWPALLAREGIDWLARSDPKYQEIAAAFRQSMTPEQLARSRRRYKEELKNDPSERKTSFDDWMREAETQEYIGGYLVPEAAPGWTGPHGEGGYTPDQERLLGGLREHLNPPEKPDPYLQLGKHIAEGFRSFIQPSIDLAMRGMALPGQIAQESIQPAVEQVLGERAGGPAAQAIGQAVGPMAMGIPEGGTRVPPAMEVLDPEIRVQPPARAQQPGPDSVLMPAPFEGQRAIEGLVTQERPWAAPPQAPPPSPMSPEDAATAQYAKMENDWTSGRMAAIKRGDTAAVADFESRRPEIMQARAELRAKYGDRPMLEGPTAQPQPEAPPTAAPARPPIPMGQGGPLRAIAGPSRLALPAPEEIKAPSWIDSAEGKNAYRERVAKVRATVRAPAVKLGDKVIVGRPGQIHGEIAMEHPEIVANIQGKPVISGFVDHNGNFLSNAEAADKADVGLADAMDLEEAPPAPANKPNDALEAIKGKADVYDFYPTKLEVRPDAFQYKTKADPQGVTGQIESQYDIDAAGFGEAFYDEKGELGKPGQWYISHGHHRHARAVRDQAPIERMILLDSGNSLKTKGVVPAAENVTIKEARARGAIRNFQDEKGTPYDAALYMRDAGIGDAEGWLKKSKIDLSKRSMDTAVGLSRLSPPLWREVGLGRLEDNIGAAIGNGLPGDMENQNALFGAIRARQQRGQPVRPEWVKARIIIGQNAVPMEVGSGEQAGLFGDQPESTMDEQADILEHTKGELEADKLSLGRAVKQKGRLEKAKNVINVQESKLLATEARDKTAQLEKIKSMGMGDATKQVLRRYAAHLKARPQDRKKILDEAYDQMLKALEVDNPTLFNRGGTPEEAGQQGMFGPGPSAPASAEETVPSGMGISLEIQALSDQTVARRYREAQIRVAKAGAPGYQSTPANDLRTNRALAEISRIENSVSPERLDRIVELSKQKGLLGAGAGAATAAAIAADKKKKDPREYDPEHPPRLSQALMMTDLPIAVDVLKLSKEQQAPLGDPEKRLIKDLNTQLKLSVEVGSAKMKGELERGAEAISNAISYIPSKVQAAISDKVTEDLTPLLGERAAQVFGDAIAPAVIMFPDLMTGNPAYMPYVIEGNSLVPVAEVALRYHGTPRPLEAIKPIENITGNEGNLYGAGLYTTDDLGIAHSYAGKDVPSGVIYRVLPKRKIKLLDLDGVDWSTWDGGQHPNSALRTELERRTGAELNINDYPKYWIPKVGIKNLREAAQDLGYGGFRHVGGKITGSRPHEVHIYWDPVNDLRVLPYKAAKGLKPIREKRVLPGEH